MNRLAPQLMVGLCLCFAMGAEADTFVPLPLSSPVFVSLTADPVVTVGGRTIDFSPNLSQQFINFLFVQTDVSSLYGFTAYRETVGLRTLNGLASLGGTFPVSPDPGFANALPVFLNGTTDLILFDLIIPGSGSPFSISQADLTGAMHTAGFATPVPEPSTILLSGMALLMFCASWLRKFHRKATR